MGAVKADNFVTDGNGFGELAVIRGFVSNRTKRAFDAFLTFDPATGKVGFEFEPRPANAGAKTATKTATKTAARKTAVKKTAVKKTAAKKAAGKTAKARKPRR